MQALRVETTISKNGELQVKGLPFRPGEQVEVIVLPLHRLKAAAKGSALRNTVLKYDDPRAGLGRTTMILLDTHIWIW